jgi:hypothetical protein
MFSFSRSSSVPAPLSLILRYCCFLPKCGTSSLFPSPPPLLRRLPYTPYLVFKTFVAIVVVVLLLLLLLLLSRQSPSVGNLT